MKVHAVAACTYNTCFLFIGVIIIQISTRIRDFPRCVILWNYSAAIPETNSNAVLDRHHVIINIVQTD